jgi:hypothetical protein
MRTKYTNETLKDKKFNHLTFLCVAERTSKKIICKWKCDCGKEILADLFVVKRGNKKSCCYLSMRKENNPMWNGVGDMPGYMWNKISDRAKTCNFKINITKKYLWELFLKQNRRCALTGENLIFPSSTASGDGTASVDRIDNSEGYVKGNVQWVHKDINWIKQDYSQDRFIELCKKVSNFSNATMLKLADNSG